MAIKYFDTLDFVRKSRALGASEDLTEFQVRQIELAIENAVAEVKSEVKSKNIASKSDVTEEELRLQKEIEVIRKEIKEVELNLQKEIKEVTLLVAHSKIQTLIWIGVNTAFMLGIMAKGFHWW